MLIIRAPEKVRHTLVHICCAPDAAYGILKISEAFGKVTGLFYNPNIWPIEEYEKRLGETVKLASLSPFELIRENPDREGWYASIRGLEEEPEKSRRCEVCILFRLEESARIARKIGADALTTVLTISPRKDAGMINRAGKEAADKNGLSFIELDLKKEDGFKKSVQLSKAYGLYRQNFCGCEYSFRK